ncbi:MAG: TIGR02186 family protein [Pseudoruegeria sp.]
MYRILALLFCLTLPAHGETVVAGLSQKQVAITANFDGSDILVFGAVKRDAPAPGGGPIQVVIAVSGPQEPVVVRRKAKRMGIWINTDTVEVDSAPSFYAVATSAPFAETISETEDLRFHVSTERAIRTVGAPDTISDSKSFTEALIRIRKKNELYQLNESSVTMTDDTLFSASFELPSNLSEGEYTTRILLTRDGSVIDEYKAILDVRKVGLERFLYNLAHEQSFAYGILSLAIAILAGWGASAVFTLFRK